MSEGQPHRGLVCRVHACHYSFDDRVGKLHLADGDCCDMSGAISLFKAIDPEVRRIFTFSGDKPDTFYIRDRDGWKAFAVDVEEVNDA